MGNIVAIDRLCHFILPEHFVTVIRKIAAVGRRKVEIPCPGRSPFCLKGLQAGRVIGTFWFCADPGN